MRAGLADGTLDVVATDHAPHPHEDKDCEWAAAAFGMLGLETALSVVQETMVDPGLLDWAGVAQRMSAAPARIGRLVDHGRPLAVGEPAHVVLYDPAVRRVVDASASASLSRNTPYAGIELPGPGRRDVPARASHRAGRRAGLRSQVAPGGGDPFARLLAAPPDLPVAAGLPAVLAALRDARRRRGAGAARHRQDHPGAAGRRRRSARAGSWSPSRGGSRPGRPPAGWPACSASRWAGRVGHTVRGERRTGRAPASRW